ncbi:Uncharacterised protein [uncultured archaeon]|nr:Uncharacterised protein [uncultured archaeon]
MKILGTELDYLEVAAIILALLAASYLLITYLGLNDATNTGNAISSGSGNTGGGRGAGNILIPFGGGGPGGRGGPGD